jgi:hypothetical protein
MVPNSNARLPAKSCRAISQAARMPMQVVSGAAMAETQSVVIIEFQAEP